MLAFLGWLLLLVLVLIAGPALGLMLALGLIALLLSLDGLWHRLRALRRSGIATDLPAPDAVPGAASGDARRNLPGWLLRRRLRPFQVECLAADSGLRRTFTIQARHAGAAEQKVRSWGLQVRRVHELSSASQPHP